MNQRIKFSANKETEKNKGKEYNKTSECFFKKETPQVIKIKLHKRMYKR